MSDQPKAVPDLKLGDTVFEADPWNGRVLVRHVSCEIVTTQWDDIFHRVADGFPQTRIRISGCPFGGGQEVTDRDWGKKYFTSLTEAHRVCAERAVEQKAERKSQIEKEIRDLQTQLEEPGE